MPTGVHLEDSLALMLGKFRCQFLNAGKTKVNYRNFVGRLFSFVFVL